VLRISQLSALQVTGSVFLSSAASKAIAEWYTNTKQRKV